MSHRKKISKTFLGTILSQLCNFAFLPLISRTYLPQDFADWAIFLAIVSTLGTVATFKYSDAIVVSNSDEEIKHLYVGSILTVVLTSIIGSCVSFFFFSPIMLIAVFLSVFGVGLQQLYQQVLLKKSQLGKLVIIGFLNSFLVPLFQFTGGKLFGATNKTLIFSATLGYLLAALSGFIFVRFGVSFTSNSNSTTLWGTLKKYNKFPLYSMTYTFLSALRAKGLYFFIHNINPNLNSYFAQSEKILNAPGNFMGTAVRPIFFHLISNKKVSDIEKQLTSLINAIVKISIPFITFSFVFADDIVPIIFGAKWISMVFIFKMLHLPAFFLMLINWLDRAFDILDAQFELFRLEIIFILVSLVIFALNFFVFNKDEHSLVISLTLSSTVYYILWIWRLFERAHYSRLNFIKMISTWAVYLSLWALFNTMIKTYYHHLFYDVAIFLIPVAVYALFEPDIKINIKKVLS